MFASQPALKSGPIPPVVILSVASRDLFLPEIVPLRFLGGTRSRRISPRFYPTNISSRTTNARFTAKFPGICTYTNRGANACKISTYKIARLRTVQNQHLRKTRRGRAILLRRNFAAAACPELRRAFWRAALVAYKFEPRKPSAYELAVPHPLRSVQRVGSASTERRAHETNSIPERRYRARGSRAAHCRTPATPVECALTQKGGRGWAA
jgi:hypothetical protein